MVLALVAALGATLFPSQTADAQSEGGRLITLHDRGIETAFITNGATLREALSQQGVQLDAKDAVEPSLDEKLVAPDYQVNIYRARPVMVVDGATRQKIVTPYQTGERIAQDAGISLYPEDVTHLTRSNDIVGDGAGLQLQIDRAVPLELDLYGAITSVRTQGTTVGEMLHEKHITIGARDGVSLSLDTPITEGMRVRVWREGTQTINTQEAVAFETERIDDADRPVGYREVRTAGRAGLRAVTYEIEIKNGVEVSRSEIASLILEQPVTQIEIIGTKPKTLPYTGGGTKTEWLAASNIAPENWGYADYIVGKESSWNPNATNKSSGACGLAQALPCGKVPGNPYNPVDSLNWMNTYVNRYGGWEGAYNFWLAHRWY